MIWSFDPLAHAEFEVIPDSAGSGAPSPSEEGSSVFLAEDLDVDPQRMPFFYSGPASFEEFSPAGWRREWTFAASAVPDRLDLRLEGRIVAEVDLQYRDP